MAASSPAVPCPVSGHASLPVRLLTLKALLRPQALARLQPAPDFRFCPDPACEVVYFSPQQTFRVPDLKVPVAHKDPSGGVPLCYCFGFTRAEVEAAREAGRGAELVETIRGHIRAGRCGCEVNNPQGRCCLGMVSGLLASP
ncbi:MULTISPECIES: putative iron-sulfur cluster-binding metallochaperone [Deinococcus]|uniref:putative iron-sulfur cluster-binding metallochaperone n=1 Tax=Deinococcus TaxID=1298 RepID=UPI0004855B66|nr:MULTISPECIES: copper chaperone Copz family protein [Deinococcus]KEF34173.1 (2Fe-2S)-binding protein [Deinococcus sp. RL]